MTEQDKRDLITQYLDAYNTFDVDGMIATLHPDVEFKNVSGGEVNASASGRGEFRTMAEKATQLFESREQTMTSLEVDDDGSITIDVSYEGTLAADVPGGMHAGESIRLDGRSTFDFADGKIAQIVDYS